MAVIVPVHENTFWPGAHLQLRQELLLPPLPEEEVASPILFKKKKF
jgi:hypothetical protein